MVSRGVLLLLPTTTYKASDFLAAADRLDVQVVVGTDRSQSLKDVAPGHTLVLDFGRPERGVRRIAELHAQSPFDAVIGVDDEAAELAALTAAELGFPHNSTISVRAARDKFETRRLLEAAGLKVPRFRRVALDARPEDVAHTIDYPCVLKPLRLSASRGVLRADNPDEFVEAFGRVRAILARKEAQRRSGEATHLLVEDFLAGPELTLEGILDSGRLRVLALFDKPDPLIGPTFEETLFVTPSRLPLAVQSAIESEAQAGCRALDLREGPVHAELRLDGDRPWIVEVAPRTIGGLCSRALRFGSGVTLEEMVLRHALGIVAKGIEREGTASGVMMMPIPRAGTLKKVRGLDEARAVPGVEEITLTVHRGDEILPLPDGHRYLGFIFCKGETAEEVERDLREAHSKVKFEIAPPVEPL
jgi:biotin carboxylase